MLNSENMNMELTRLSVSVILKKLCTHIASAEAKISDSRKEEYLARLASYDSNDELLKVVQQCHDVLTHTDIQYLLCFIIEMEYDDIINLFNIEKSTLYTVRYRIRKKLKNYGGAISLVL